MFKWFNESCIEIDAPIAQVWEFFVTPSNWPKWMEEFESCHWKGEIDSGSIVHAKFKNKKLYFPIVVSEAKLYESIKILIKISLFLQESHVTVKSLSPNKTQLVTKSCVTSILTPFMKSYFSKKVEKSNSKFSQVLVDSLCGEALHKPSGISPPPFNG